MRYQPRIQNHKFASGWLHTLIRPPAALRPSVQIRKPFYLGGGEKGRNLKRITFNFILFVYACMCACVCVFGLPAINQRRQLPFETRNLLDRSHFPPLPSVGGERALRVEKLAFKETRRQGNEMMTQVGNVSALTAREPSYHVLGDQEAPPVKWRISISNSKQMSGCVLRLCCL